MVHDAVVQQDVMRAPVLVGNVGRDVQAAVFDAIGRVPATIAQHARDRCDEAGLRPSPFSRLVLANVLRDLRSLSSRQRSQGQLFADGATPAEDRKVDHGLDGTLIGKDKLGQCERHPPLQRLVLCVGQQPHKRVVATRRYDGILLRHLVILVVRTRDRCEPLGRVDLRLYAGLL